MTRALGADLERMRRDAGAARGTRPYLFTDLRHGTGLEPLMEFVSNAALLDAAT